MSILLSMASVTVYAGGLYQDSGIHMVQTDYFDIIYPSESSVAAGILAATVDNLYLRVCRELSAEPDLRLPVVLNPSHDQLNAYFTVLPYNRIVVYDTLPFSTDTSGLTVFSETLVSVFYHELVHAVSLNIKSPLFRGLSSVFGDYFNPALLYASPLFTEGAAVALESETGEGRLNDGFALHVLRQAVLEDRFPSWQDAAGARDVYPSGDVPYIFGGAFTRWLIDTYGKDRYGQFLYEWGKLHFFKLMPGVFKLVYGIPLKDAWERFRDSVTVPGVPADPVDGNIVSEPAGISREGLYLSLTASSRGTAWIDGYSGKIQFRPSGSPDKVRTVTSFSGANRISFSIDGAYLAVSCCRTEWNGDIRNSVYVYDMDSGHYRKIAGNGLRDGTVFSAAGGRRYAVGIRTEGQESFICGYKITGDGGNFSVNRQPDFTYKLPAGAYAGFLTDCGTGQLAFTGSCGGLSDRLYLLEPETGACRKYRLPEQAGRISLKSLSATDNGVLMFSWASGDTFPGLGFFIPAGYAVPATGTTVPASGISGADVPDNAGSLYVAQNAADAGAGMFYLSRTTLSGGVFAPVPADDRRILYCAHFFDYHRILLLDAAGLEYAVFQGAGTAVPLQGTSPEPAGDNLSVPQLALPDTGIPEQSAAAVLKHDSETDRLSNYNPFRYLLQGTLFPVAVVPRYSFDLEPLESLMLGGTWLTGDPEERCFILFSGGYDLFTRQCGVGLNLFGTLFSLSSSAVFSDLDFYAATAEGNVSVSVPAGRVSRWILSDTVRWYGGRYQESGGGFVHTVSNRVAVQYTTLRSGGKGFYNVQGVQVTLLGDVLYSTFGNIWYGNTGGSLLFRIPGLIPLAVVADLFPALSRFADVSLRVYLLTLEVQKGIPVIPVYVNRLGMQVAYTGSWLRTNNSWDILHLGSILRDLSRLQYQDTVSVRLETVTSLNTGIMTGTAFTLYGEIQFTPARKPDAGQVVSWTLGGNISL